MQVMDKLWLWPPLCSFGTISLLRGLFSIVETSAKRFEVNEEEKDVRNPFKTKIICSNEYVFCATAVFTMQNLNCLSASILCVYFYTSFR